MLWLYKEKCSKMNKKQKKAKLTLDIIACALSAVSTGLSIAAFVISLVRRNEK